MSNFLNAPYIAPVDKLITRLTTLMSSIPQSFTAAVARFSIAAVFWRSGQTKIEGFAIDVVAGDFNLGWPSLDDTTVFLFEEEYSLPLLNPEFAAYAATVAEHIFPALILIGLATRFSALALLVMTLVIQVFVYPGAYPTHGVWAAVLLFLMTYGPGKLSLDAWIERRVNHAR